MTRQYNYDQREIAREQRRSYQWKYWWQWISLWIALVATLLSFISALLSWFPVQWLIVLVACSIAIIQGTQVFIQMTFYPPQKDPIYETLLRLEPKQNKATAGKAIEQERASKTIGE